MLIYWVQRSTIYEPLYATKSRTDILRYISKCGLSEKCVIYSAKVKTHDYVNILADMLPEYHRYSEPYKLLKFIKYLYSHKDDRVYCEYIKQAQHIPNFDPVEVYSKYN